MTLLNIYKWHWTLRPGGEILFSDSCVYVKFVGMLQACGVLAAGSAALQDVDLAAACCSCSSPPPPPLNCSWLQAGGLGLGLADDPHLENQSGITDHSHGRRFAATAAAAAILSIWLKLQFNCRFSNLWQFIDVMFLFGFLASLPLLLWLSVWRIGWSVIQQTNYL